MRFVKMKEFDLINRILGTLRPFKAFEVFNNLYQGSQIYTKEDIERVSDLKIKTVIDLEGGFDPNMEFLDFYLYWPIRDVPWLPDRDSLLSIGIFGADILNSNRRVLVHCRQGLNRSGLVCAQIMSMKGKKGEEILDDINKKIPFALWNPVFRNYVKQL
jgi:protein tyrosine/serine phosphatase